MQCVRADRFMIRFKLARAYSDKAVMELHAEESRENGGVLGEARRNDASNGGLHVGAFALAGVEPELKRAVADGDVEKEKREGEKGGAEHGGHLLRELAMEGGCEEWRAAGCALNKGLRRAQTDQEQCSL